jgi:hypothetical protein
MFRFKIFLTIEFIHKLNHLNWREHLTTNIWSSHIWNYSEIFKFKFEFFSKTIYYFNQKKFLTSSFYIKHIFWVYVIEAIVDYMLYIIAKVTWAIVESF